MDLFEPRKKLDLFDCPVFKMGVIHPEKGVIEWDIPEGLTLRDLYENG